jgi:hypothetical protein
MAGSRLPDPVRVPIGLRVSEADAAGIDQVLARPEYAGWSRAEWCREIIRSALRYYAGDSPSPDGDRVPAAAPEPVPAGPAIQPQVSSNTAVPAGGDEPAVAVPEPPSQRDCRHPADARDYETGSCAVCGAILWD